MQPVLANTPRNSSEWNWWAWHHRQSHDAIRKAIAQQRGVQLADYIIEPIPPGKGEYFLEANNHLHSDFNNVLGLQSEDLQTVDMNNESELRAWIHTHWLQHKDAETRLGISS